MSHTPGPWVEDIDDLEGTQHSGIVVVGADDEIVCRLYEHMGPSLDRFANDEANARLIVAAPAMLEALQLIQGFNWSLDDSEHGKEIKRRAFAAITLALTGVQS